MDAGFVNRERELAALNRARSAGGLISVYGRRRLGKTRLLTRWLAANHGLYAQAIEGSPLLQLDQLFQDLKSGLRAPVAPRSWEDLFAILDHQTIPRVVCLDEFPYLVESDPSLPSRLQRWWDHRSGSKLVLVLCGSSRRMMHGALLDQTAPLYGRSRLILRIDPMEYRHFCSALSLDEGRGPSFGLFALVGGVPRYWELLAHGRTVVEAAESLYLGFASYMENEPRRLLADEHISGTSPVSVLEAVGRGAHKPSEIAARLGVPQTQLSKVLFALLDSGFLKRDVPLGQSERNPKVVLYTIADPSLRFWYQVYSPHKTRWLAYSANEKQRLLDGHASGVFEDYVRSRFSGARRYWEKAGEFDVVRSEVEGAPPSRGVVVSEVKFRPLSAPERSVLLAELSARWSRTEAARRWPVRRFEVLDLSFLRSGAA